MPYSLNPKISGLTPYDPISGDFRVRLDANESYLPLPQPILREVQKAVAEIDYNRYPNPYCTELCRAFAGYYDIDPGLVTAGNGSDELISIIAGAFLMKGETVVTVAPDFSMYRFYASLTEANCVTLQKDESLTVNVDALIVKTVETKARMVLFSNPCNPTSLGLCKNEVVRLIRSVNALVVLDEAYMDFWDQSLLREVSEYDNLIILRTSSKAIGCAGIRLGFAVANRKLTNAIRAVKSPYNVNSITQAVGTILFSHGEALSAARDQIILQREALYQGMLLLAEKFPGKFTMQRPCTNFVFIKLPTAEAARKIFEYLLSNQVAIRNMGEYLRITAGSPKENEALLRLLGGWLKKEEESS